MRHVGTAIMAAGAGMLTLAFGTDPEFASVVADLVSTLLTTL